MIFNRSTRVFGVFICLSGCVGGPGKQQQQQFSRISTYMEPIRFSQFGIDDCGNGAIAIHVTGVKEFINKYGINGWRQGLTDNRWAIFATATNWPGADRLSEDDKRGLSDRLRVSDVFAAEYLRLKHLPAQTYFQKDEQNRDIVIKTIIRSLGSG